MRLHKPAVLTHQTITTRAQLIERLMWAVTLELSTIPPYLTAMYSLQDATSEAYATIKAVVLEEMLHLGLAGNMLSAVGGHPDFNQQTVPEFPTYIPHHAAGGPFISLQPMSTAVASDTFCAIEAPSDLRDPPPEGDNYETIGQFYAAIEDGFEQLYAKLGDALFVDNSHQLESGKYFGGGGGRLFKVRNLATAKLAIRQIVAQGEGAHPNRPGREGQPFGGRFHYSTRPDGTYGPILGVGVEQSHYERFRSLADGDVAIGATWPMQTNIKAEQIQDAQVRALADLSNQVWVLCLAYIQAAYQQHPRLFFSGAVPLMHSVLPVLARKLMQTPLDSRTGSLGPNAGPGFEFVDLPQPCDVATAAAALAGRPPADSSASDRQHWAATLESLVPFLSHLPALGAQ